MIYVLDSSFVCAQVIPDEKNPNVNKMYAKIKQDDEKYVPQLFWYEMTNIFNNLMRRNRYSHEILLKFFPLLDAMHITCDYTTGTKYSIKLLSLCNEYNLSSYDAAYLELAERRKAILCTMDEKLRAAAKKSGLAVLN